MHRYEARIAWQRDGATFSDNRYSRGHEWSFDGGVTVRASSSPLTVKVPYSVAEAVDPEEALVAATSSCHMLWFLSLAVRQGLVVDRYSDDAFGMMEENADGKVASLSASSSSKGLCTHSQFRISCESTPEPFTAALFPVSRI